MMQILLRFISFLFHTIKGDALWVMKRRGLKVGKNVFLGGSYLDHRFLHLITIGDNVTLAGWVTILAHDASTKRWLDYSRIGKVTIGNRVFIGSGTIVLPGVTIGDNVVVGAGSVVANDIPSGQVFTGIPAKYICTLDDFLARKKEEMGKYPIFDFYCKNKNDRRIMLERMKDRIAYIR
jgi:maltose O-acetyltransferase